MGLDKVSAVFFIKGVCTKTSQSTQGPEGRNAAAPLYLSGLLVCRFLRGKEPRCFSEHGWRSGGESQRSAPTSLRHVYKPVCLCHSRVRARQRCCVPDADEGLHY